MSEHILVVDDERGCREGLRRLLEAWGYEASTASNADEAMQRIDENGPTAVITDLVMPGTDGLELLRRLQAGDPVPVIVLTGQGTIDQAVQAIRLGATDILEKPVEPGRLKILLEKLAGRGEILGELRRLRTELRDHGAFGSLRGISGHMREVFRQIEKVAPTELAVLVVGESGTGKELVAQTVHRLSPRRSQSFVEVNCAAIPAMLLESEIFGHEKGAFTGAVESKIGCFEMAHHGTLFLDEISEMDGSLQAKLLRVLQEQRFRRVGGVEVIEADARVVAATNRAPEAAIAEGRLREDLYYRLNVFTIELPSLRERPEDIPMLARHFAEQYARRTGEEAPAIGTAALEILLRHAWPGNVRELKNAVERAAVLAGGASIEPQHLPPTVTATPRSSRADPEQAPQSGAVVIPVGSSIESGEREMIRSTLRFTDGNKTRAARILEISTKTLHNKVKKYSL